MTENIKNSEVVVSREQAESEFDRWAYEIKRIRRTTIEKDPVLQECRENIIENIMDGTFTIDEQGFIEMKLVFPENISQETLRFKPRLKLEDQRGMRNFKENDHIGRSGVLLGILCSINSGLAMKLDMADMAKAQDLLAFYSAG